MACACLPLSSLSLPYYLSSLSPFVFIVHVVINAREEVFRQCLIKFVELLIEVVLLLPCGDIPLHIPLEGVKDTLAHVYIMLCALCAEPPFPQYILNIVEIKQLHVQKLMYVVSVKVHHIGVL